jgi:hypothetical protein
MTPMHFQMPVMDLYNVLHSFYIILNIHLLTTTELQPARAFINFISYSLWLLIHLIHRGFEKPTITC